METLSGNIERFFTALETPEYAYLFLEPILIWGIGFGLVAFIFATLVREPKTQSFGLIILIVSCMMVGPYCNKRKVAEKRIVTVYQVDQPSRASGFTAHTSERRGTQWLYYLTAILATATILLGIGKSKLGGVLMAATIVFGVITLLTSSLQHYKESQLHHPNLRQTAAPPPHPVATGQLRPIQ